jgi:hypothetical protein
MRTSLKARSHLARSTLSRPVAASSAPLFAEQGKERSGEKRRPDSDVLHLRRGWEVR